jgi:hypothetical protein
MPLENRTLEVAESFPGLAYPMRVCVRKFLGICTQWGAASDDYNLDDPIVRKTLRDKGFVCRVEEKP